MEPELLRIARDLEKDRPRVLADHKARTGRPMIGVFPQYFPQEIITAAGATPVELWGGPISLSRVDAHLQSFVCSMVRGNLEYALAGELAFLDGVAFPSTCDSIQNSSFIWRRLFPKWFTGNVNFPANPQSSGARGYLRAQIRRFRSNLGRFLQAEITDESLAQSLKVHNQFRRNIRRWSRMLAEPRGPDAATWLSVLRAGLSMDRAYFNELLASWRPATRSRPRGAR